jgi:hypothetical protein
MNSLSARLTRSDLLQLSTLYFAILLFSVLVSWPQGTAENRSWFVLVQVRIMALTLLGLAYGTSEIHKVKPEQRITLLALLCLGLFSLPLELACYAASFPETPIYWAMGITLLDTIAFFGLGLALSKMFHKIRLQALLPVINIVIMVLINTFDFGTGKIIISPLLAVTLLSPFHFAAMLVLAILTLLWLLKP